MKIVLGVLLAVSIIANIILYRAFYGTFLALAEVQKENNFLKGIEPIQTI